MPSKAKAARSALRAGLAPARLLRFGCRCELDRDRMIRGKPNSLDTVGAVIGAVNKLSGVYSPPCRGGCGISKKLRSHRTAADGVVSSARMFMLKGFAGLTTPSARTKVAARYFLIAR